MANLWHNLVVSSLKHSLITDILLPQASTLAIFLREGVTTTDFGFLYPIVTCMQIGNYCNSLISSLKLSYSNSWLEGGAVNCRRLAAFDSILTEANLGCFELHTLTSLALLVPTRWLLSPDMPHASVSAWLRALLCAIAYFIFICNCSLRMQYLLKT